MKQLSLRLLAPSLLGLLATATLPAQGVANLIGITRVSPALRQYDHQNCAPLAQCPLAGMPGSVGMPNFVGGTGWDPVRSGAWVSNGLLLAKYDDGCAMQCPPMPIPTLAAGAFVTGLEVVVGMNQLWMIDSTGVLHFYSNTCPPNPIGQCNTGLAPTAIGHVTTGLAVDEGAGFVFISYAQIPGGPDRIVVLPLAAPCNPIQQLPVPPCAFAAFGNIQGLACDWGKQVLYVTDGFATIGINYVAGGPGVAFVGATCCPPLPANEPMIGLAIRPGRATSQGGPCANGACGPCPMVHTLVNDPLVGNTQFRLGLDQAQSNSFAFCMIGDGPCNPVGVGNPFLCGPIWTVPYLGYLGANVTGGGIAPCDGSTTFLLPIPNAPALANLVLSSQCLTICFNAAGALGTGMSNCLSWQVQGQ